MLLAKPPPPPAEYVGKARVFRASIDAEDASIGCLLFDIIEPLRARLRTKKRNHRQDRLMAVAYRWRTEMPTFGRLDLQIDLATKGELRLIEWRASAGQWKFDSWGADARREPDISLVEITVEAAPGKFRCVPRLCASISLHALSRRFQRCSDQSHETFRADLLTIAKAHGAILASPALNFRIATPRGEWVGETVEATTPQFGTQLTLSVRSFLN